MRLDIITRRLADKGLAALPRLEDIGAAMMAAPNPCGRTFESFMPLFDEEEAEPKTGR
jgi:hypothetical protein